MKYLHKRAAIRIAAVGSAVQRDHALGGNLDESKRACIALRNRHAAARRRTIHSETGRRDGKQSLIFYQVGDRVAVQIKRNTGRNSNRGFHLHILLKNDGLTLLCLYDRIRQRCVFILADGGDDIVFSFTIVCRQRCARGQGQRHHKRQEKGKPFFSSFPHLNRFLSLGYFPDKIT